MRMSIIWRKESFLIYYYLLGYFFTAHIYVSDVRTQYVHYSSYVHYLRTTFSSSCMHNKSDIADVVVATVISAEDHGRSH